MSSAADITTAMQSAQPGDVLVMASGTWTNQHIDFAGAGTAEHPITLRAQAPGSVTLNGSSRLSISGDWLVVDSLNFSGGSLASGNVVEFRGSRGIATNSRFTNSAIVDYNPTDPSTRYFWVSMYGQSNRVDHNYFSGQNHSGVTLTVWRNSASPDYHLIDNNYFANRPEGTDNGFETIRLGTSDESLSDSFTVVENNLFERVDGEIEIISNKSGNNTFRYNTFRESSGTLTLRHGNDNRVEGNFFLGQGKQGSGGVRVIGERQTLINNYFQGLDGRADGAISISAGVPNSALNEYYQVKDAVIAHNTIVDVQDAAITFDHGFSSGQNLLAENVTIANNLIWSTNDPLFEGVEGNGWTWEGNIAFGQSLGPVAGNPGVAVVDPQLTRTPEGMYRPGLTSPAIDAGVGSYSGLVTTDMDGQPRVGIFDVGADEVSSATIVRMPLLPEHVGPTWLNGSSPDPPGGGGCTAQGCAIQAEDFAALLDPDSNGQIWSTVSVAEALGGHVLKAPDGDRVDLPQELHDTIATFELQLQTPGTYTSYFRGRGFSGASDSLFTPDDFGVDPDNNESLTSDGTFRWEKGPVTFTIAPSHVGVPLEFRVGMREQQAEFDAFVLHLGNNLSSSELDALFAILPGDYNLDGVVDLSDYAVWRDSLGNSGSNLPADGDGSGIVDAGDYQVWKGAMVGSVSNTATSAQQVGEPATVSLAMVAVLLCCSTQRLRTTIAAGRCTPQNFC